MSKIEKSRPELAIKLLTEEFERQLISMPFECCYATVIVLPGSDDFIFSFGLPDLKEGGRMIKHGSLLLGVENVKDHLLAHYRRSVRDAQEAGLRLVNESASGTEKKD